MKIKKFTIEKIKDGRAMLKSGDLELVWPAADLPDNTGEGDVIFVSVGKAEPTDEGTAKAILNEILKEH